MYARSCMEIFWHFPSKLCLPLNKAMPEFMAFNAFHGSTMISVVEAVHGLR